ncbi:MAG: cytochrome c [Pseudomonadota bacterium]
MRLIVVLLALIAFGGGVFWVLTAPDTLTAEALPEHEPDVDNGRYMFFAGGCASCHAAEDQDDPLVLGGGHRLETPFGTFVAPNISSDPDQGIGGWSMIAFVNAMVRGVSPNGAHYYPAFPYTSYARMRLEDVMDLKAFLDTVPTDATPSEPHELSFPYSVRRGLGLWKMRYLPELGPVLVENDAPEVARGRYLADGPSHCAECHTPRDVFGGLRPGLAYAGAVAAEGEGWVPNITPHPDGIEDWSTGDIAFALETGFTPDFDVLGSTMAAVVRNMAELTPEDREAIAAYLAALPPLPDAR